MQLNRNVYLFNHTYHYLFNANYTNFNQIYCTVSEIAAAQQFSSDAIYAQNEHHFHGHKHAAPNCTVTPLFYQTRFSDAQRHISSCGSGVARALPT